MTSAAGAGATGADQESSNLENGEEHIGLDDADIPTEGGKDKIAGLADILEGERGRQKGATTKQTSLSQIYGHSRKISYAETEDSFLTAPSPKTGPQYPPSIDEDLDGPDDTPSVQDSGRTSPAPSILPLRNTRTRLSPSPSPSPSSRPFERRFLARVTSSSSTTPLARSPAFVTPQSRRGSILSQATVQSLGSEKDVLENGLPEQSLWEVIRWTKLKKLSNHAFSEAGKRTFGRPTYLTVAASIAVGTSKGLVLLFDYHQTLKGIIGQGTAAVESGGVTALAISADHSTIAVGHANGSIFTWDTAHPAKPFLHIPPLARSDLENRNYDGHVADSAVLHVGFLGQRRTALVSADDCGMGFSHLATRGLGAVARTVKTTRILGRYPMLSTTSVAARKPSSVLAFSPLPLGNVERSTDRLGLTALLTPYLLVVVSTTPVAQTQFKLPREKDIAAHSAMTGCMAWFPAVKLKSPISATGSAVSKSKLVYCWSNVLSVLDIEEEDMSYDDPARKPELVFRPRSQWKSEEAILAVQWLSRSVISVLTVSQRLVILQDYMMHVTDSSDLNPKHMYHQDLFSKQLGPLVDKVDQVESMHGVISDAYHMSFKAYKGRLFLLGMSDMSMGTISNWADRLMALMEIGKPVTAIELATSYYTGDTDTVTIGLPEDGSCRQQMVKDRLVELLLSSLRHLFKDDYTDQTGRDLRSDLQAFATAAFTACMAMDKPDFLFDEVYEWYSDASMQDIFLYTLESYIIDGKIGVVPPLVLKDLLNWYASMDLGKRLEDIICSLQTYTMDIDQVTTVCKQLQLYDALIYVWAYGLGDYVTPMIELMSLFTEQGVDQDPARRVSAQKIFPYLAYTLTGRQYPDESEIPASDAAKAKASVYGFLFSHTNLQWPRSRGKLIATRSDPSTEPVHPYLHALLHFDSEDFLSMLNEVFEDSFLNGLQDQIVDGMSGKELDKGSFGLTINRQRVVNILLEVMTPPEFEMEDTLYLHIFIARNLAKFAQFILLPNWTLHRILVDLCNYPHEHLASECQLSVEYLLSIYHPSDSQELVPLLLKASFFRVLKSIYRGSKQYAKWLETYFDDPEDRESVFGCIRDCLRPNAGLSAKQICELKGVIVKYGKELANIDPTRAATCLRIYASDLLDDVFVSLDELSRAQYFFLQSLFELRTPEHNTQQSTNKFVETHRERYVELMCRHEPDRVADYVSLLKSGDLKLDKILPTMESSGVIDAAVALLAQNGLVRDAITRLVKHLTTLKIALTGLLDVANDPDTSNAEEAVDDLLEALNKYARLGMWLCQGQSQHEQIPAPKISSRHRKPRSKEVDEKDLTTEEALWLDLIDTIVAISRAVSAAATSSISSGPDQKSSAAHLRTKASKTLRLTVQQTFTALLTSTTSVSLKSTTPTATRSSPTHQSRHDHRFLHILRAFLTRASTTTPSLSDLRKVLDSIFSAYAFETAMLSLANDLLDRDLFLHMEEVDRKRRVGWRPRGGLCDGCRRRIWGQGSGNDVWEAWRMKGEERERRRRGRFGMQGFRDGGVAGEVDRGEGKKRDKGKGKAVGITDEHGFGLDGEDRNEIEGAPEGKGVVVFSCMHMYHRTCLERAMALEAASGRDGNEDGHEDREGLGRYWCPVCIVK